MDGKAAERVESDLISVVERRRAEGVSVAVACREAGISTSTYYRKRRTGSALAELAADRMLLQDTPPATLGLMSSGDARSWPFTARAPFYWDQVFADELTDSFVRREFGRGPAKASGRALKALADVEFRGAASRAIQRVRGMLPRNGAGAVTRPLAAAALFALVAAAAVGMVAVAADPAAWIDPSQTRVAETPAELQFRP
jgi:hypothetical protein